MTQIIVIGLLDFIGWSQNHDGWWSLLWHDWPNLESMEGLICLGTGVYHYSLETLKNRSWRRFRQSLGMGQVQRQSGTSINSRVVVHK